MEKALDAIDISSEFTDAGNALREEVSRNIICVTVVIWLFLQIAIGFAADDGLAMRVWALLLPTAIASFLILDVLPQRPVLAQAAWLSTLMVAFTTTILLFPNTEVALLYAILPFIAAVTLGWEGGLLAQLSISVALLVLALNPLQSFVSLDRAIIVVVAGLFAGSVGWASSRPLYVITQWSLKHFALARQDMVDARQSRAQLAQLLQDLDRAYYRLERTNAALVAAWRSASKVERFKTDLATKLSHELRTPLNLIIGFCEMIITAPQKYGGMPIPPAYRSDLNAIYRNARHLMALVNDVLDLARIDVGKLTASRAEVDVATLVDEAIEMVREYVQAKGLQLHVELADDLPPLWVDRLRIRQVLLNLLVNAARFTEEGFIHVEGVKQDGRVMIDVRDSGMGIPEDKLEGVFQEFQRTGTSRPKGWPGTGLGLPISKKYIEMHGGSIGVESTYGEGSTFWFTLPCSDGIEKPDERKPHSLIHPTEPVGEVAKRKRVAVAVHHDPQVLSLLQRYLDNYQVETATTITEGISLANETKALALIADQEDIPDDLNDDILFIHCPLPDTKQAARALGAQEFLVKPISEQQLRTAVDRVNGTVETVLIADDDLDMTHLLRRILTPQIATENCLEAHNGADALRLLREKKPDLLLLDLLMPEMTGHEVLEEVRNDPTLASIPVIVVSARDLDEIHPPTSTSIQLHKTKGFEIGEVIRALGVNLSALAPGWH